MEKEIIVPDSVKIEINNFKVSVSGEKGNTKKDFTSPLFQKDIKIKKLDNKVLISSESEKRKIKSMVGTIKSQIEGMIKGVQEPYVYKLKIVYVHFPMKVKVEGKEVLVYNFLGEKTPRRADIIGDTNVEVKGDEIIVSGINKEHAGQTAANLETLTKISARDRRVFQDGIYLESKGG